MFQPESQLGQAPLGINPEAKARAEANVALRMDLPDGGTVMLSCSGGEEGVYNCVISDGVRSPRYATVVDGTKVPSGVPVPLSPNTVYLNFPDSPNTFLVDFQNKFSGKTYDEMVQRLSPQPNYKRGA